MRVIHYLKDGSQVNDITGHVVRVEDAGALYKMIRDINRKAEKQKTEKSGNKAGSSN